MVSLKNPIKNMVINMRKTEMSNKIEKIEEMKFYGEYPSIIVNEKETSSEYEKDIVVLEADGFHTYHTHGGYGLGCFPVHEEYLGMFVGDISGEKMEEVYEWVSQIHSDMKEWMKENEKLGVDMGLIENTRGLIAHEISIMEDFHPMFLNTFGEVKIYIGGYDDPSSYGSHESRYLSVDYINESWNQHIITDVCRGGNGRGCFDVWEEMYGIYYDSEYLGVVYNTLKKWKNMEREYFSSIKTLSVDYYTPEEGEIVILKNGIVKSSTKDDGRYKGITVFVEFDRFSRSGNPVYKKVGDTLTSAV